MSKGKDVISLRDVYNYLLKIDTDLNNLEKRNRNSFLEIEERRKKFEDAACKALGITVETKTDLHYTCTYQVYHINRDLIQEALKKAEQVYRAICLLPSSYITTELNSCIQLLKGILENNEGEGVNI